MAENVSEENNNEINDVDNDDDNYNNVSQQSESGSQNGNTNEPQDNNSEMEYTDSEESDSDSYVYPWPTSSDDSFANLSADDVIQKILLKLPTYDPLDSDENKTKKNKHRHYDGDDCSGSDSLLIFEDRTEEELKQENDDQGENRQKIKLKNYEPNKILEALENYELYLYDDEKESGSLADTEGDNIEHQNTNSDQISTPTSNSNITPSPVHEAEFISSKSSSIDSCHSSNNSSPELTNITTKIQTHNYTKDTNTNKDKAIESVSKQALSQKRNDEGSSTKSPNKNSSSRKTSSTISTTTINNDKVTKSNNIDDKLKSSKTSNPTSSIVVSRIPALKPMSASAKTKQLSQKNFFFQ